MGENFWQTALSFIEPGKICIRGYRIEELIKRCSFGDVVYLMFVGELPQRYEGKMIEAILVSSVDHSFVGPSVDATRFVASSGVPLQASVAAGIIALGEYHGGAIEECARILQETIQRHPDHQDPLALAEEIVEEHSRLKKRILGLGHPMHNPDPRTGVLLTLARELGIAGSHIELAEALPQAVKKIIKRDLPLNIDGTIAAIISDMRIDWRLGKGFFILSRAVGMIAHAHEQMTQERPFKEVPWNEITYTGPPERDLP
ncbi:MAG: citryl-CoA lyase [Candidatus Tectomicrobia bacterium]|nr:citryl-CoA lyase [Candidatus Tectomicrobia bacterium]